MSISAKSQIQEYVSKKKDLQSIILSYLNDECDTVNNISVFLKQKHITENRTEFKLLLDLLKKLANNHCRNTNLFDKLENIFLDIKNSIKQTFSNLEIYEFFKSNKRTLLSLLKTEVLIIDQSISDIIINDKNSNYKTYKKFFYTEIKPFLSDENLLKLNEKVNNTDPNFLNTLEQKRKNGNNDGFLCRLIQNDSVEEFVSFMNKTNTSLNSKIEPSLFETNLFLIKNQPTLIEYSTFYGSIQIFNYLRLNNVPLQPSLMIYAIHGNNPELIHILEENNVEFNNKLIEESIKESIKCHHNDITNYILNKYVDGNKFFIENKLFDNFIESSFQYYNYEFFPSDFTDQNIFYCLCKYGYFELVKIYFDSELLNRNTYEILNIYICFFNEISSFYNFIMFLILYF